MKLVFEEILPLKVTVYRLSSNFDKYRANFSYFLNILTTLVQIFTNFLNLIGFDLTRLLILELF